MGEWSFKDFENKKSVFFFFFTVCRICWYCFVALIFTMLNIWMSHTLSSLALQPIRAWARASIWKICESFLLYEIMQWKVRIFCRFGDLTHIMRKRISVVICTLCRNTHKDMPPTQSKLFPSSTDIQCIYLHSSNFVFSDIRIFFVWLYRRVY